MYVFKLVYDHSTWYTHIVHTCKSVSTHACIHTQVQLHNNVHNNAYANTYLHTKACKKENVCIHTYMHTYIHTRTDWWTHVLMRNTMRAATQSLGQLHEIRMNTRAVRHLAVRNHTPNRMIRITMCTSGEQNQTHTHTHTHTHRHWHTHRHTQANANAHNTQSHTHALKHTHTHTHTTRRYIRSWASDVVECDSISSPWGPSTDQGCEVSVENLLTHGAEVSLARGWVLVTC